MVPPEGLGPWDDVGPKSIESEQANVHGLTADPRYALMWRRFKPYESVWRRRVCSTLSMATTWGGCKWGYERAEVGS